MMNHKMTREQAAKVAKDYAKAGEHHHEYGITSWILDAIITAHGLGYDDGQSDTLEGGV